MSTLQETAYRNDSMLFSLHKSYLTSINYDLKVCLTASFSLTKRSGQNCFVMEYRHMCKNLYMQS